MSDHYVAHIKVVKVTKNQPTEAYPRNNPPPATRVLATMFEGSLRATTLENLRVKVHGHLLLLDEDDEIPDDISTKLVTRGS